MGILIFQYLTPYIIIMFVIIIVNTLFEIVTIPIISSVLFFHSSHSSSPKSGLEIQNFRNIIWLRRSLQCHVPTLSGCDVRFRNSSPAPFRETGHRSASPSMECENSINLFLFLFSDHLLRFLFLALGQYV
jgi:hypothetical protein